jgi:hypothetical protein
MLYFHLALAKPGHTVDTLKLRRGPLKPTGLPVEEAL